MTIANGFLRLDLQPKRKDDSRLSRLILISGIALMLAVGVIKLGQMAAHVWEVLP